jgi:prepilin-type N-terminal cleavage/methylation domain-containing protein
MSAPTSRPSGFTLIELMVASAVGLIIVLAALAAFDLQAQFSRNTERLLGAQSTAGLGFVMMQRDLENAGLRFRGGAQNDAGANWATAVRPYDNLGANIIQLDNDTTGTSNVVAPSGTTGGFLAGTDAFEVLLGSTQLDPRRVGAQVQTIGAFGAPVMIGVKISPNPFMPLELSAVGPSAPLVMFWNDDMHCMGRVIAAGVAGTVATVNINTVNADFGNAATNWVSGCPGFGMNVEILQYRHRYLVFQSNAAPGRPARVGLHLQSNPFCDPLDGGVPCTTDLDPPMMVSEGIDNMQVAWRVPDGWGPDGGVWCQHSATENCDFDKLNMADSKRAASIVGAQIVLVSHGQEIYQRPNEPIPQVLNYVPSVATDGVVRSIMQTSVLFRNVVNP